MNALAFALFAAAASMLILLIATCDYARRVFPLGDVSVKEKLLTVSGVVPGFSTETARYTTGSPM